MRPSMSIFVTVVASTAFSASLFTLCVVLLALFTNESRRRVVFRVNVLAICMSLTMGVLVGFVYRITVDWLQASVATATVLPLLPCDAILFPRLFALYPLSNTLRAMLSKMLAFSLCVNFTRVVVAWLIFQAHAMRLTNSFAYPNLIVKWTAQTTDNM